MVNNMKTLAELAEEYLAQANHLKAELEKIPKRTDDYKLKYKRTMYEDMYAMQCAAITSSRLTMTSDFDWRLTGHVVKSLCEMR